MNNINNILRMAKSQGKTLGAVESLTGGAIISSLTSISGASKVIKGGLITYTNEEKSKLINISKTRLEKYGAISEEIAHDMAKLGRYRLNVDICLAVTGNAGPTASSGQPIGRVYLAIASSHEVTVSKFDLAGTRLQIRRQVVDIALKALEGELKRDEK